MEEPTKKADQGKLNLVYFDGSGFNLWAKVVYAWQKRGERSTVPVTRGKSQNVLGFMWHRCQRFESFVFEETIDSNAVIACFDRIARNLEQKTVIVIDNAPIHRSEEFQEKVPEWAQFGRHLNCLPTDCPSLNKIEVLRKKIKYERLSFEAYTFYKNLCEELDQVLSQIGSKYYITFA